MDDDGYIKQQTEIAKALSDQSLYQQWRWANQMARDFTGTVAGRLFQREADVCKAEMERRKQANAMSLN